MAGPLRAAGAVAQERLEALRVEHQRAQRVDERDGVGARLGGGPGDGDDVGRRWA